MIRRTESPTLEMQSNPSQRRRRPLRQWRGIALALLMTASVGALAAPVTRSFGVTVFLTTDLKITPGPTDVGECKRWVGSSAEPRKVSIACGSGVKDVTGDAPRFLLHVYQAGEWIGTVDTQMETGTITSWRVVHGSNREYLEMMVGW